MLSGSDPCSLFASQQEQLFHVVSDPRLLENSKNMDCEIAGGNDYFECHSKTWIDRQTVFETKNSKKRPTRII